MKDYNVSTKIDGKWRTLGRIKKNQYDNYQLSFKKTDEFMKFINGSGEWLNFSLFEPKEKDATKPVQKQEVDKAYDKAKDIFSDEVPFVWILPLIAFSLTALSSGILNA